jgi:hypothetical protein
MMGSSRGGRGGVRGGRGGARGAVHERQRASLRIEKASLPVARSCAMPKLESRKKCKVSSSDLRQEILSDLSSNSYCDIEMEEEAKPQTFQVESFIKDDFSYKDLIRMQKTNGSWPADCLLTLIASPTFKRDPLSFLTIEKSLLCTIIALFLLETNYSEQ